MSFMEAMEKAVIQSKRKGVVIYVTPTLNISLTYEKGWLFKAYPGGRKVLSMDGKKGFSKMSNIYRQALLQLQIDAEWDLVMTMYGEHGRCECPRPGYWRKYPGNCRHCKKPFKHIAFVDKGEDGWLDTK